MTRFPRIGVALLLLACADPVRAQFTDPDHVVVAPSPDPQVPLVVATNPDPSARGRITLTCRSRGDGPGEHGSTEVWARPADGSGGKLLGRCPPGRPTRYFIAMENVAEVWILNPQGEEGPALIEYELGCVMGPSLPRPSTPGSRSDWLAFCGSGGQRRGVVPFTPGPDR